MACPSPGVPPATAAGLLAESDLIERLWKLLRKEAFTRWHESFEAMEQAVSEGLDNLGDYREELDTLMTEKFQRHPMAKVPA